MVYFLAMGLSPLVVYIHERISFRWCMFIASLLFCFSMSITPFLNNFYLVLFGFSVPFGLSISFVSTLSVVTQREYFSKHFGLAVGLRYTANAVGTIVLSFILPIILSDLGYKMTFLSLLIFSPVPIVFGMVARHQPRSSSDKNVRASVFSLWREFLQDKSFALNLMAVAIYFLICFVPLIYMVSIKLNVLFQMQWCSSQPENLVWQCKFFVFTVETIDSKKLNDGNSLKFTQHSILLYLTRLKLASHV